MSAATIFVSHTSKYSELARSLKLSLQALEDQEHLEILISEDMAGATDWRGWIEKSVRDANVFLLLYPHCNMDMGWPNYELGRFYADNRHIACIKNVDIAKPPATFEPYQAYTSTEEGILDFFDELFVKGRFTNGKPINPLVGRLTNDFSKRAREVAHELSLKFTDARVEERFYERRVVVSLAFTDGKLDAEKSTVTGNHEGMTLLNLHQGTAVAWSAVRKSCDPGVAWPDDLERELPSIAEGEIPPTLSPFLFEGQLYIPVVAKAASVDELLRSVVIIFVAVDANQIRPLIDWTTPKAMPAQLAALIRLVRMMLRSRWDILEHRFKEVTYDKPASERMRDIRREIVADYDKLSRDAERQGFGGLDMFYSTFDRSLRESLEKAGEEWVGLMGRLQSPEIQDSEMSSLLQKFLVNNAAWLKVAASQFAISVEDLGRGSASIRRA